MEKCKSHCACCKIETNHEIKSKEIISKHSDDDEIHWSAEYQIIECLGCETLSFRIVSGSSEDYDFETGEPLYTIELYPESASQRDLLDDYYIFPSKIRKIYSETIDAINHKMFLLSAVGLRMLIEAICIEESISGGNLKSRIDELAVKGLLSKSQADFLHHHRFIGNDAAHEIKTPKRESIIAALDIAETLLKTIYILPKIAAEIERKK